MPVINTRSQIEVVVIPVTPDAGVHDVVIMTRGGMPYRFQTSDGCLITRWGLTVSTNRQVTPALDGSLFFFIFGMLPTSVVFDGIILPPLAAGIGDGLGYLNAMTANCLAGRCYDLCACAMQGIAMLATIDRISVSYGAEVPGSRIGSFRIQMSGIP